MPADVDEGISGDLVRQGVGLGEEWGRGRGRGGSGEEFGEAGHRGTPKRRGLDDVGYLTETLDYTQKLGWG